MWLRDDTGSSRCLVTRRLNKGDLNSTTLWSCPEPYKTMQRQVARVKIELLKSAGSAENKMYNNFWFVFRRVLVM